MSFQTHKAFVHLQNSNCDIWWNPIVFWLSIDRIGTTTFKALKGSKYIFKIVCDSGSIVILWSYENIICPNKTKITTWFNSFSFSLPFTRGQWYKRMHSSACKQATAHPGSTSQHRLLQLHTHVLWCSCERMLKTDTEEMKLLNK